MILGGLNWGLYALNYNVVDQIFGPGTDVARIIYGVIALAAIYAIFRSRCCSNNGSCKS